MFFKMLCDIADVTYDLKIIIIITALNIPSSPGRNLIVFT